MKLTNKEKTLCDYTADKLEESFVWSESTEGKEYWLEVYEKLKGYAGDLK